MYGRNSLRDYEFGSVGYLFSESFSDKRVSLGIYRTRRVVENKHLGLFEQCSGYTKPLLLSARYVCTALLYISIVLVGECHYKVVRLRLLAHSYQILVGSVGITPSEVFLDSTREKYVFLQYYRNLITQRLQIVVLDVDVSYVYRAFGSVIQSGDKVDKRSFAATRTAEYTYRHTRFYVEIDVSQSATLCLRVVFEAYVFKSNVTVFDFLDSLAFGILQVALFFHNFYYTLCRRLGYGYHYEYHTEHRKR